MNIDTGRLHRFDPELATFLQDRFTESLGVEIIKDLLVPGQYFLGGGCIRSYYDGTPVNDLDIYILDDATWEHMNRVAQDLHSKHVRDNNTSPSNGFDTLSFNDDLDVLKEANRFSYDARYGTYKYPYKQIDHISFDNKTPRVEFLRVRYVPDFLNRFNAGNLPPSKELKEVDFITATSGAEIIEGFDFTCCSAGVEFSVKANRDMFDNDLFNSFSISLGQYKQHPHFLTSIIKKQLRLTPISNMEKCGLAYKRLYKYFSYGYKLREIDFKFLERLRRDAYLRGLTLSEDSYEDL